MPNRPKLDQFDIRHVDRRELYTDFKKRIAYLKAFLNLVDDDIIVFNKGAKYLKTAIPDLTHRLYSKMLEFDITARALRTRNTACHAHVEDLFTIDSPHVERRKIFWKWYLTRLCNDPSQMEYWEYLEKVGKMHTGKVLLHPLNIEYVHMNACLRYVEDLLIEWISLHPEMTVRFKFALIRSLNKIMCIQNDLISKCYIPAGQEYEENDDDASTTADESRPSIDSAQTAASSSLHFRPRAESQATTGTTTSKTASSIRSADTQLSSTDSSYHPPLPSCLTPGLVSSSSRPTSSAGESLSAKSMTTSTTTSTTHADLARPSSSTPATLDSYPTTPPTTSSSSSLRPAPANMWRSSMVGFVSPFTVESLQTLETKIWSEELTEKATFGKGRARGPMA
ncbi:protoglobin family protein [Aspergillus homomorphus CBS 101889]|uniref:Globin-sensor domain-containing protein n=1 Tax=Aspergillus homomorphus (strain CBS 101889) TaxID=1450537 RepID=A0A395HJD6_ASPHC|nr:hypothetical protein BO97DRAFT_356873 [Aspergillus homomorphus CBS 101889]RAL07285.1 hypothetical protein BO97DRAFT_356873 [Aspergillus homomorphus CBS 101889]